MRKDGSMTGEDCGPSDAASALKLSVITALVSRAILVLIPVGYEKLKARRHGNP